MMISLLPRYHKRMLSLKIVMCYFTEEETSNYCIDINNYVFELTCLILTCTIEDAHLSNSGSQWYTVIFLLY